MTHACCTTCRLRIHATVADPEPCPTCGRPLTVAPAAEVFGLPLVPVEETIAEAVAVRLPGDPL